MSRGVTAGTAGHVDHGKTTLVGALTGRDTDRLAEEKRRGLSIELGFAELDLGGRRLSLIDVPGHERFVRTMIAGASGIDLFLMVIAADDGVMPQTREHATVLRSLGIDLGAIALTKCDRADQRARARAGREARELMPQTPIVEVSAHSGQGLRRLRRELALAASAAGERGSEELAEAPVVLHIDRVFTISGRGTVVTGTLWSGTVCRGDRLTVLPCEESVRVREVQVHDRPCDRAGPRQRVALNLVGLRRKDLRRGDVITSASSQVRPSYRLDVALLFAPGRPVEHERVQVHHGTRDSPARLVSLGEDQAQLRLEAPLLASAGDRLVVRRIAPPDTLGGATVLAARPPRHGAADSVAPDRRSETAMPPRRSVQRQNGSQGGEDDARGPLLDPLAVRALGCLRADGAMPRGSWALAEALQVPRSELLDALGELVERRELVRIKPDIWIPTAELAALKERVVGVAEASGEVTVADLRDALGITRKYSLALLEHLDSARVMIRRGDKHALRNGTRSGSA